MLRAPPCASHHTDRVCTVISYGWGFPFALPSPMMPFSAFPSANQTYLKMHLPEDNESINLGGVLKLLGQGAGHVPQHRGGDQRLTHFGS